MEYNDITFTRRSFLQKAACLTGTLLLPSCAHTVENKDKTILQKLKGYQPELSMAWIPKGESKNSYKAFKIMLESATDFSWLSKGDRVLIKVALNSGNRYPATSDPWSLWCLINVLRKKGAGKILVGDQSGVQSVHWTDKKKKGQSGNLFKSSGLLRIIGDTNTIASSFEERGYHSYRATLPVGRHHWKKPLQVTTAIESVDHIIYLPRVSSHVMGDITSGIKLAVGFLREDSRLSFHQGGDDFYALYEEINHVPEIASRLRLIVSSGTRVFSNLGPDNGHVSEPDYGIAFASEDLAAHELLAYSWLKWNRKFNTPWYSRATTGYLTNWRSAINKGFVYTTWDKSNMKDTPAIPYFEAGNIYKHPSIQNFFNIKGGIPEKIHIEQTNRAQDKNIMQYIQKQMTYS